MRIKHGMKKSYNDWLKNNEDGYGRTCFVYAERWADLLEIEYIKAVNVPMKDIIEKYADDFSHKADVEGITGFMAGVAASILTQCWEYGKIFNVWWNKQWGVENAEGTVNPAIMTVSTKE